MHVNMIPTHYSLQYSHIQRIATLYQNRPTTCLHIALENLISVLCNPYQVNA
jgi:hypothetical protein